MTVPSSNKIAEQKHEVTPLELFFDLVFVLALLQQSRWMTTACSASWISTEFRGLLQWSG
jgi:low temperature requirement protein LtrA